MTFRLFLLRRMADLRLSHGDLATALGVSNAAVSSWTLGTALPRVPYLEPLARVLQVDIQDVVRYTLVRRLEYFDKRAGKTRRWA